MKTVKNVSRLSVRELFCDLDEDECYGCTCYGCENDEIEYCRDCGDRYDVCRTCPFYPHIQDTLLEEQGYNIRPTLYSFLADAELWEE